MPANRNVSPTILPLKQPISVVIPAAGVGNRMRAYGPKSLTKIGDSTIIDRQLKYIYKYLYKPQIVLVGGFQFQKLKKQMSGRNICLVDNKEWESTNVSSSIRLGLRKAKYKRILILYGDLIFNAYTLRLPLGNHSMLMMARHTSNNIERVGCVAEGKMASQLMFDFPNEWTQISYFTGKELVSLKEICYTKEYENHLGFELINMVINKGGKFALHFPQRMKIMDIDSSKDLLEIGSII